MAPMTGHVHDKGKDGSDDWETVPMSAGGEFTRECGGDIEALKVSKWYS